MEVWSGGRGGFGDGRWLMGDRSVETSTLKDLMVCRFKVSRYWEQRSREGSAHSPAIRRIPSVADENGGGDRSLAVGVNLGRSRILHQSIQFATNASAFGCDLFACFFPEHDDKSNEFERTKQTIVILPVDNDIII